MQFEGLRTLESGRAPPPSLPSTAPVQELGVLGHPSYKVTCMLDHAAMVTVSMERYGVFDCKPLAFLWAKFPEHYSEHNSIMMDDLR